MHRPLRGRGETCLALFGAEDGNPSPDDVRAFAERARAAGRDATAEVYEGAGHAFFADYRPSYRPEPAAKLWAEIVPFLARHLGADAQSRPRSGR